MTKGFEYDAGSENVIILTKRFCGVVKGLRYTNSYLTLVPHRAPHLFFLFFKFDLWRSVVTWKIYYRTETNIDQSLSLVLSYLIQNLKRAFLSIIPFSDHFFNTYTLSLIQNIAATSFGFVVIIVSFLAHEAEVKE